MTVTELMALGRLLSGISNCLPSVIRLVRSWSTLGLLSRLVVGPAAEVVRADCVAVGDAGSNVAAIPANFDLGPRADA